MKIVFIHEQHTLIHTCLHTAKIEEVTNVPRENYESFQVLRYEENQRYAAHHDYGSEVRMCVCVRVRGVSTV